jgi:hypothetical protein
VNEQNADSLFNVHHFACPPIYRLTRAFVEVLMKIALTLMLFALLFMGLASNGLADELNLKASGPGQWTIYNSAGQDIGTLRRVGPETPEVETGGYGMSLKDGQLLGVILSDGTLQLTVRHATITPSVARFYLDVLEALKTIK